LSIPTDLVNHYPWLPSLKKYYSEIAERPPVEFIIEVFSKESKGEIKERLLTFFKAAFENLEEISEYKVDSLNVYVYLVLKILLYVLDNKIITNRIANLYSKVAYNELVEENNDSNLYDICQDLGLNINYYNPPISYGIKIVKDQRQKYKTNFTIYYIDYLQLASNLRDEYRKLAHNSLSEGYVFIQNRRLMRLIQEYVRDKLIIKETEDKASLKAFIKEISDIKEFKDLYDEILGAWAVRKEEFDFTFKLDLTSKEDLLTLYPPCVKEILSKAQEGQNLVHHERLFIVWFLLALDYPVEKVVDIFSTMPDFNREKTTYQVNFAKKKQYTPYQCSTLISFNLCMAAKYKDELCLTGYGSVEPSERKKLKHPLGYVRIKQYRAVKEEEYFKNKAKMDLKKDSEKELNKVSEKQNE
jgi:DNA primase large subunit